ncbi:MAG: hypothetical protein ACKVVP_06515 [Chloroflexota bacterium]
MDLATGLLSGPEIDSVVAILSAQARVNPPEWMIERATEIGRTTTVPFGGHHLAELAFDSQEQAVLAGARAVALRSRRLLFESSAAMMDLEVTGIRGRRRELQVNGHVLSRCGDQPQEVRFAHPTHQYILSVDRRGEFELESIHKGDYAIEVDFGAWVLAVPTITF